MIRILVEADRWIGRIEMLVSILLLILIVATTATNVFFRYALTSPIGWAFDVSVLALVWLTFVGAASVYRQDAHIAASSLPAIVPRAAGMMLVLILAAVTLVCTAALIWYGYQMAQVQHRQQITLLGLPRSLYSMPVIWFGLSVTFHLMVRLMSRGLTPTSSRGDA